MQVTSQCLGGQRMGYRSCHRRGILCCDCSVGAASLGCALKDEVRAITMGAVASRAFAGRRESAKIIGVNVAAHKESPLPPGSPEPTMVGGD